MQILSRSQKHEIRWLISVFFTADRNQKKKRKGTASISCPRQFLELEVRKFHASATEWGYQVPVVGCVTDTGVPWGVRIRGPGRGAVPYLIACRHTQPGVIDYQ